MKDVGASAGGWTVPDGEGLGAPGPSRPDPFQILVAEHDILRQQLGRAIGGTGTTDARRSLSRTAESVVGSLRVHLEREDRVLYPLCERVFDGRDGATAVMRADHAAILEDVRTLMKSRTGEDQRASLAILLRDLESHFLKEERVLFPLLAARVSNPEATNLVRRLRAVGTARRRH